LIRKVICMIGRAVWFAACAGLPWVVSLVMTGAHPIAATSIVVCSSFVAMALAESRKTMVRRLERWARRMLLRVLRDPVSTTEGATIEAQFWGAWAVLGRDERAVLTQIAERLCVGYADYGRLDIAHDKRDFARERINETFDWLVYDAIRELRSLHCRQAQ